MPIHKTIWTEKSLTLPAKTCIFSHEMKKKHLGEKNNFFLSPFIIGNEPTKECTVKCIEPEGCLTIKENLHSGAGAGNSKRIKNSSNFVLIIVITISLVILLSGGGLVFVGS